MDTTNSYPFTQRFIGTPGYGVPNKFESYSIPLFQPIPTYPNRGFPNMYNYLEDQHNNFGSSLQYVTPVTGYNNATCKTDVGIMPICKPEIIDLEKSNAIMSSSEQFLMGSDLNVEVSKICEEIKPIFETKQKQQNKQNGDENLQLMKGSAFCKPSTHTNTPGDVDHSKRVDVRSKTYLRSLEKVLTKHAKTYLKGK